MAQDNDTRMLLLIGLGAVWVLAYGYSFAVFALTEPTGDGFVRGMNRVRVFFGWQGVAGMLAIAIWGLGRQWPKGSPARRISLVPIGLALLLIAGISGLILWTQVTVR
ncbi:MAG: hypothetical protein AAFY90_06405 [Pseudomonadota bacterium]